MRVTAAMIGALLFTTAAAAQGGPAKAKPANAKPKVFAQSLVEKTQAGHPEAGEIGIAARAGGACKTIASTDKSDIGEKCERDDSEPMRTGKPFIEKERDGYDVSLPLHDKSGKLIGSAGIGFKPKVGQTEQSVVAAAEAVVREMEAQIGSKAALFAPSKK